MSVQGGHCVHCKLDNNNSLDSKCQVHVLLVIACIIYLMQKLDAIIHSW